MHPEFYRAAQHGHWEAISEFPPHFYTQRTGNGNTLLHILAQSSNSSVVAVNHIVAREPVLIFTTNAHKETPLIIASRTGHSEMVLALLECARTTSGTKRVAKLLRALDQERNTALHEAVRYNRHNVVRLLIEKDPEYYYKPNSARESPLYIAVEKGNDALVNLMLSTWTKVSMIGPDWKTVLHAAALKHSPECMKLILEKWPNQTKKVDLFGRNALHYAARYNHTEMVKILLSKDKSMNYVEEFDDLMTPLNVAVKKGHVNVIREILSQCPDSWEMITSKYQNMLHLAVKHERKHVLDFIFESSWASELINKKDVNGNTPLHLYVATNYLEGKSLVNYPGVDIDAMNNDGLSPLDIITQEADKATKRQSSIRDELLQAGATPGLGNVMTKYHRKLKTGLDKASGADDPKSSDAYLIVATLIATVAFAAGFAVPGGYDNTDKNSGLAVLSQETAFVAFVVTDSLAMLFSIIAVLCQFEIVHKVVPVLIPLQSEIIRDASAFFILFSTELMVIAFLSGLYVVIPTKTLKIYLVAVGCVICFGLPLYIFVSSVRGIGVLLISFAEYMKQVVNPKLRRQLRIFKIVWAIVISLGGGYFGH